jgi:hypothetical protein
MSAASSATMTHRVPATARPAPSTTAHALHSASAAAAFVDREDEFRLDLRDIPRIRESMEIDNLRPTLLSRFLDLILPLKP